MYNVEIWGGASACYLDRAIKVQKSAIRTVHGLAFDAHISSLFKNHKILKLADLHAYRVLLLMHKAVFSSNNLYLFCSLSSHSDVHSYPTRNCTKLLLPHSTRSKSQLFISFIGSKLWNKLPDAVRAHSSMSLFKINLKSLLIANY